MNYGDIRAGQALEVKDARQAVQRYLTNRLAFNSIMAEIASGEKLTRIAERRQLEYAALYSALTTTFRAEYRAAKAAHAEMLAEKNLDMADRVERLELPHDVAKAASGIRQWHMERTASEQWGQKSTVDMNLKGVVGLHLEAIRELSKEPIDADYEEVSHDADDSGHGADSDDAGGGVLDRPVDGDGKLRGEELL